MNEPNVLGHLFEVFITWQTLLLGVGIFLVTFGLRRFFETAFPKIKTNRWWTEFALPIGPYIAGALFAVLAKKFPWPSVLTTSFSARVMYGIVCGGCCGWLYGRLRKVLGPETPPTPDEPNLK